MAKKKIVIVGLGNIGTKYQNTRHNVGFMFINYLNSYLGEKGLHISRSQTKKLYSYDNYYDAGLFLLKPLTMMNNSGLAVKEFLKYSEIPVENMLLVHDDLDLDLGTYKLQQAKAPRAHNGVISVEKELNTKQFFRVRIGINSEEKGLMAGKDFVLSKFTKDELYELEQTFAKITTEIFTTQD